MLCYLNGLYKQNIREVSISEIEPVDEIIIINCFDNVCYIISFYNLKIKQDIFH